MCCVVTAPAAPSAGANSPLAARPWWWPTCAKARPTPTWPAGSRSAPRPSTATSARRLTLLAALAPTLEQAIAVARGKAFVILDGTLLRIDRVGMCGGRDRPFYSGKHKAHGTLRTVASRFAAAAVGAAPVLDDHDPTRLAGLVTVEQLLDGRLRDLAEEHHRERPMTVSHWIRRGRPRPDVATG